VAKRNRRGGAADEYDGDEPFDVAGDDDGDSGGTEKSRGESRAVSGRSTTTATRFGFGLPGRFIREVVAELRKVIWPTRKELVTYAVVVIFFVAVMMTIIAGFDYGFARAVQWVFGS
jgi:preprotein translocase subunit SecE